MYYIRYSNDINLTTHYLDNILPCTNNIIMDLDTGRLVEDNYVSVFECENAYDIRKHDVGYCSYRLHSYTDKTYFIQCSSDCIIVLSSINVFLWYRGYAFTNNKLGMSDKYGVVSIKSVGNYEPLLRSSFLHYTDDGLRCIDGNGLVKEVQLYYSAQCMSKLQFRRMVLL